MSEADYLIVGQGLAGTLLSYHLIKRGKSVIVIDDNRPSTASKAAAGMFNPITGQRSVLTWKAGLLFPYLDACYKSLEKDLNAKFYHPIGIYKPFGSIQDYNDWMGRSSGEQYAGFIKSVNKASVYPGQVEDPFGGVELKRAGFVNIKALLSAFRSYLKNKKALYEEKFSYDLLNLENGIVAYGAIKAEKILFCEGPQAVSNPFFSPLPFGLVKGETLTVKLKDNFQHIINKEIFVLPLTNGYYKVGATYDREDMTNNATEEAKEYLTHRLGKLIKSDSEIIDHTAGVRPATRDRRPFIGLHPQFRSVGIFNGLGTKGVSLGPYFARQFANYLLQSENIDHEATIDRCL